MKKHKLKGDMNYGILKKYVETQEKNGEKAVSFFKYAFGER